MVTPDTLLIATSNPGKHREVSAILEDLPLHLESLADHPPLPEPVEDGATFEQNAERKALHYAELTGRWTLADDSGLMVDALDGAPGVYSARYAGPENDAAANNAKLIEALAGIAAARRSARFYCAIALADGSTVLAVTSGTWEGRILETPRGVRGFGYDPLFFVSSQNMTAAEMDSTLKNRLSHRAHALRRMREILLTLLRKA